MKNWALKYYFLQRFLGFCDVNSNLLPSSLPRDGIFIPHQELVALTEENLSLPDLHLQAESHDLLSDHVTSSKKSKQVPQARK